MAIINIGGGALGASVSYASTDTVNHVSNFQLGAFNVVKTDNLGMNINWSTGVIATANGTGFFDIKGSRGSRDDPFKNMVKNISVNVAPRTGDYLYYTFNGATGGLNRMQWQTYQHATHGLIIQNYAVGAGDFKYIVSEGLETAPAGLFDSGSSLTSIINDIAAINFEGAWTKSNAGATSTWNRVFLSHCGTSFGTGVTRTCSINDLHFQAGSAANDPRFAPVAANIITIIGYYAEQNSAVDNMEHSTGAGVVDITTFMIRSGNIPVQNGGTGEINLTGGDLFGGAKQFPGFFGNNANAGTLTDVALFGTNGHDESVFSDFTDDQVQNLTGFASPRITRKFPRTFSSVTSVSVGDNTFTVTATAGSRCKARIVYWATATPNEIMTTDWDAPSAHINGYEIPSSMTDWVIAGKTFDTAKSIKLSNLKEGTAYTYFIEGKNAAGETMDPSAIATETTSSSADITLPSFAGDDSNIAATNPATDSQIDLTWDAASDDVAVDRYAIYHSTVSGNVFSDGIKQYAIGSATSLKVGGLTNGTALFFGVRALDAANNASINVDVSTAATPTAAGTQVIQGPVELVVQ